MRRGIFFGVLALLGGLPAGAGELDWGSTTHGPQKQRPGEFYLVVEIEHGWLPTDVYYHLGAALKADLALAPPLYLRLETHEWSVCATSGWLSTPLCPPEFIPIELGLSIRRPKFQVSLGAGTAFLQLDNSRWGLEVSSSLHLRLALALARLENETQDEVDLVLEGRWVGSMNRRERRPLDSPTQTIGIRINPVYQVHTGVLWSGNVGSTVRLGLMMYYELSQALLLAYLGEPERPYHGIGLLMHFERVWVSQDEDDQD